MPKPLASPQHSARKYTGIRAESSSPFRPLSLFSCCAPASSFGCAVLPCDTSYVLRRAHFGYALPTRVVGSDPLPQSQYACYYAPLRFLRCYQTTWLKPRNRSLVRASYVVQSDDFLRFTTSFAPRVYSPLRKS